MTTTTLPHTGASGSAGSSASSESGRPTAAPLRFASVPARLAAGFLDVILGALAAALLTATFFYGARQPLLISGAVAVACVVVGRGLMLAATGWSPGGRLLGVRFIGAQDRKPSPVGVFLHADITFVVMLLTLGVGGIVLMRSVAADAHKRGWHDRRSGIMVVSTRGSRAAQANAASASPARSQSSDRTDRSSSAGSTGSGSKPGSNPGSNPGGDSGRDRSSTTSSSPRSTAADGVDHVDGVDGSASGPGAQGSAPEQGASWSEPAEHSWPRVAHSAPSQATAPGQEGPESQDGPAPTTRTPEEPGRHDAPEEAPRKAGKAGRTGKIGKIGRMRPLRRDSAPADPPAQAEDAASSWDSPTRPGTIGANPVTSQPMEARPAKEQPWQPRSEQASSPAAQSNEAQPRGPVPQRESLFAAERYSFTASSSRHSDVAHTFDTASVLPAADRNTQALIDSVPWSSVPTSLDSTTMDSLPEQIRAAMEQDGELGAHRPAGGPHSELSDTESLPPVSAPTAGPGAAAHSASSAAASTDASQDSPRGEPARHHSVNLLDPREVPGTGAQEGPQAVQSSSTPEAASASAPRIVPPAGSGAQAQEPEGVSLPRSIAPASYPASHAASPVSHLASPAASTAPRTPAGDSASTTSSPLSGSSAATASAHAASATSPATPVSPVSHAASSSTPGSPYVASHAAPTPRTAASASRAASPTSHAAPASAPSASSVSTPSPYAASPVSHAAPSSTPGSPYVASHAATTPSAGTAGTTGSASPASHAATTPSAASAASVSPAGPTGSSTRVSRAAQHHAAALSEQGPTTSSPRRPVPPTVEVPRVTRRRRASATPSQTPTAMPPTMPRPSTANPPLSVRLVPMMGGDPLMIHEPTVVGRDPDNISSYPGAERISLSDPTRSVSKTHAAIFPLLDGVWVTDLHSTNGTRVENKDGSSTHATPEEALPAMDGSTIYFGRIGFRIEVI